MLDVTNWADKNTWVCRAAGCGLVLPSRVKLVLHMRRSHALTALEYFREHKDSLTTDIQHTCQVAPPLQLKKCMITVSFPLISSPS